MPCRVCRFLGKKEVNVHWKVEEFHRELKQLTGVESCQCRKGRFKEIMKASKLRLTQDKVFRGLAKNRKVIIENKANKLQEIRLDKLATSLTVEAFIPVQLNLGKPKIVWVANC